MTTEKGQQTQEKDHASEIAKGHKKLIAKDVIDVTLTIVFQEEEEGKPNMTPPASGKCVTFQSLRLSAFIC